MTQYPVLQKKLWFVGRITARTGLHIGGSDVGLSIGGADNVVVRSAHDGAPYVPGSSLKGKLRSLLERAGFANGFEIRPDGQSFRADPCSCADVECRVCQVFGVAADSRNPYQPGQRWSGVGRLIVRDGHLANADELATWRYLEMPYTELKTEVAIDRLTSRANPRHFERVPAGAEFLLDIVLNLHEGDRESEYVGLVLSGLELLSHDFLGGQGTRGYGAVQITLESIREMSIDALRKSESSVWRGAEIANLTVPWVRPQQTA